MEVVTVLHNTTDSVYTEEKSNQCISLSYSLWSLSFLKHQPVDSSYLLQVQLDMEECLPPTIYIPLYCIPQSTGPPGPPLSPPEGVGPAVCVVHRLTSLTGCPVVRMFSTTVLVTMSMSKPASLPSWRQCLCSPSSLTPTHTHTRTRTHART